MVQLLQNRTQPITLYKVRAHVNIDGNEQANKLAKEGLELEHKIAIHPYEPMLPHTITKRTYGPQ
jgi:ribonuclease HI